MQTILIDGFDFWNMKAMKYYSFTSSYSGNRTAKAKELATSYNYLGSRKMDGFWSMIIKDMDGQFHLRSRDAGVSGSFNDKAEWIPHICEELSSVPNGTVLVGEIYFPNNEGSRKVTTVLNCLKDKCLDRQKANGWLHFYVFDVLAYNGKSLIDHPFEERIRTYLEYNLLDVLKNDHVEIADYVEGPELWDLFGSVIAAGGEGIVITRKDCKYLPGKRTAWMTLKMKRELEETIDAFIDGGYTLATRIHTAKTADLLETWPYWENTKTGQKYNVSQYKDFINGVPVEAVTKYYYYGWAGSVSFSVMKDGKPVSIANMQGITEQLRQEIVSNPEKWIGKVAELSGMMSEHIDGGFSLRHGVIKTWRDDKRAEDCSYDQIKDSK